MTPEREAQLRRIASNDFNMVMVLSLRECLEEIDALRAELAMVKRLVANPSESDAIHYEMGRRDERLANLCDVSPDDGY